MDDRTQRVLDRCEGMEKIKITTLYNAVIENLKAYQTEKSSAKLRDWQDAEKALTVTVDMLWQKYFDEAAPFENRTEVLAWLQGQGYKIKKTRLYQDCKRGFLKVQPDGTVRLSDVREYIAVAGLEKIEDKTGLMLDDQADKIKNENKRLILQNEKLQLELDQMRGDLIRKTDVQTELAVKIGAMESGTKNLIRMRAADWITATGGDPGRKDALIDMAHGGLDELLDDFGRMEEISVTVAK